MKVGRLAIAMTLGIMLCTAQLASAEDGMVRSAGFRSMVTQHDFGCGCESKTAKVEKDCGCSAKVTQNQGCSSKCRPSLRECIGDKIGQTFCRIDATLQTLFPCRQVGMCPSDCGKSSCQTKSACQTKSPRQSKCGCGSEAKGYPAPGMLFDEGTAAAPLINADPFEDDEAADEASEELLPPIPPVPDAAFTPPKPARAKQPERVAGSTRLPLVFRPVNALPMEQIQ